jgi:glycosyltransferase involved in cell wall biosynthesis
MCRLDGAALIAEATEAPFVSDRDGLRKRFSIWLWKHLTLRLFDGAVVISSALYSMVGPHLRDGVLLSQIPVLVDTNRFAPANQAACPPNVTYIGTLDRLGECERAIRIWALASQRLEGWHLTIVGRSESERQLALLRALAESLGVANSVRFVGLVPRADLPATLQRAGILILPRAADASSAAGLPNKLGEYLASGRPVVTTKVGDVPRYLKYGESAILVDPDDEASFAEHLVYLATHPAEAKAIGINGRLAAKEHFDTTVNSQKLLAAFEAAWKTRGSPAP